MTGTSERTREQLKGLQLPNSLGLRLALLRFRGVLLAGGPGSGCHGENCGRPAHKWIMPFGLSTQEAKEMPRDPTWVPAKNWKKQAYGGVLVNKKGQFLLREPKGHFDGYSWTWPKGKLDNEQEHPVDVALREVREETGRKGAIFDTLPGTYRSSSGSHSNFFLMRSEGYNLQKMDKETQDVRWVSYDEAKELINQSKNPIGRLRDKLILERAQAHMHEYYRNEDSITSSIAAGGPGSGCRGPNCGRPKGSAHFYLVKHGWKKSEHVVDKEPGAKKAKHAETTYTHWKHGKITISHDTPNTFKHETPAGTVHEGKVGKFGSNVSTHLKGIQGPPTGMAEKYVHTGTNDVFTWNTKTGKYETDTGVLPPEEMKKYGEPLSESVTEALKKMEEAPKLDKPPEGMPEILKSNSTALEMQWKDGAYQVTKDSSGEAVYSKQPPVGVEYVKQMLEKGNWYGVKPEEPVAKDIPPNGMPMKLKLVDPDAKTEVVWQNGAYQLIKDYSGKPLAIGSPESSATPATQMQKGIDEGKWVEKKDEPVAQLSYPKHMTEELYNSKTKQSYKWDEGQKGYVNKNTGKVIGNDYVDKFHESKGGHVQNVVKPEDSPVAPVQEPAKTTGEKEPPLGLGKEYTKTYPGGVTADFIWNPTTEKYDKYKPGQVNPAASFSPDFVKMYQDTGTMKPKEEQAPKAQEPKPPDGLIKEYTKTYKTGSTADFIWNPATGEYDKFKGREKYGSYGVDFVKQHIGDGSMKPKEEAAPKAPESPKPPHGLPEVVKNTYTGNYYVWNKDSQLFMQVTGGSGKYTPSNMTPAAIEKYHKQGFLIPAELPPSVQHLAPNKGGPIGTNTPHGLPLEIIDKTTEHKLNWSPAKGKYVDWETNKVVPKYKLEQLFQQGKLQDYKKASAPGAQPTPAPKPAPVAAPKPTVGPIEIKEPVQKTGAGEFTFKENAKNLGGAHDKYLFTDKEGKDWLFKPATTLGGQESKVMAYADEVASKIATQIRGKEFAVDAKAVSLNIPGQGEVFGSVQKMIPQELLRGPGGKFKDFVGRDINSLNAWEVEQLQHEQVVDWLLSNHDAHGGQFLRVSSQHEGGRGVIGIDKTQAFKYFPNDKLATDYHPNASYGEKPPIYNDMYQAVKAGKLTFDADNTLSAIKKAEAISDLDYKKMLMPYAAVRFQGNSDAANKFLDQALERKQNLRKDFETFFSGVLGTKFKFEAPPEGEVSISEPYPYPTNPAPKFAMTTPSKLGGMLEAVQGALSSYGYEGHKSEKAQFSESNIRSWANKAGANIGYGEDHKDIPIEKLQQAAKGMGLYPEMAAKFGIQPKYLLQMQSGFQSWSASTTSQVVGKIRQLAQELVQKKCCTEPLGNALELEHAITKAKLLKEHPDGYVTLSRVLSGNVAEKIASALKKHEILNIKNLNADGWSDNKSFSGQTRLHADHSLDHVITSYKTNHEAWAAHIGEHEYVVAVPGNWKQFKQADVKVYH
jgi:8-oxo-dGTP pyrophosphatase MutT (NUDIX family)